jgi:hypothetical protein
VHSQNSIEHNQDASGGLLSNTVEGNAKMRRYRAVNTKIAVCKVYERLRKRWQSIADGPADPSDEKSHEVELAHEKMTEHRKSCEICAGEDLAIEVGDSVQIEAQNAI